jgi:hypothetical protein
MIVYELAGNASAYLRAWVSGSKLGAPDNQFRWCPSGLALLPNSVYRDPPGTWPDNDWLSIAVFMDSGVTKVRFMEELFSRAVQALCEER